jgi:protocatechuate 3,4-dioxygenase beta subunit
MRERPLNRRRFLYAATLTGCLAPIAGRASAADRGALCVLTPEEEAGPFYLPGERVRSEITEGRPGLPLVLDVRVLDAATCAPLAQAAVDIWQCDALGVYSGFPGTAREGPPPFRSGPPPGGGPPPNGGPPPKGGLPPNGGPPPIGGPPPGGMGAGPPGGPGRKPDLKQTFLRGIQLTAAQGGVRFATIFPGFYAGRVNHIHLKVHVADRAGAHSDNTAHTGQIFFPEPIAAAISATVPYAQHHIRRTRLDEDHVFMQQNGRSAIASLERTRIDGREGYIASITVAVNVSARAAVRRPAG